MPVSHHSTSCDCTICHLTDSNVQVCAVKLTIHDLARKGSTVAIEAPKTFNDQKLQLALARLALYIYQTHPKSKPLPPIGHSWQVEKTDYEFYMKRIKATTWELCFHAKKTALDEDPQ